MRKMKTNKTTEQSIKQTNAGDGLTNTNHPHKIGPHLHKHFTQSEAFLRNHAILLGLITAFEG